MRLAIIGCGAISAKHLDAVAANGDSYQLAAVCDVAQDRADAFAGTAAEKLGTQRPAVYTSDAEMLQLVRPDVVAIATPSAYHAESVIRAVEAGAHVIAEKPLALSTDDLDRIERAAQAAGRLVTVCYITRFAPHIRALARKLERGSFGRIMHVGLSIYWNRNSAYYEQAPWRGTWKLDGGALMNQCTHGLDLLQWIAGGRPTQVRAELRRFAAPIEAEDFGTAIISFSNGATATFVGTVATYPKNLGTTMTIMGETGTVQLGGGGLHDVTAWRFADNQNGEEADALRGAFAETDGLSGHAGVYQDMVSAVTEGREPSVTLQDARRSVELVLAIYQSAQDGAPADLPLFFSTERMAGHRWSAEVDLNP